MMSMKVVCILLAVCWMVCIHPASGQILGEGYEILSNGDTVCWKNGRCDTLFFLNDIPRYKLEKVRQNEKDYNEGAVSIYWGYTTLFDAYVKKYHATLTNFCYQMLTYEERMALVNSGGEFFFHCAVDSNGRVVLIPFFAMPHEVRRVFTAERLYDFSRHIKNICQYPLPPASMTMGCMFLFVDLTFYFSEEGVFYERSCGYY